MTLSNTNTMATINPPKEDVLTYKVPMNAPFEMVKGGPWDWIQDGCNNAGEAEEYYLLDRIYAYLDHDIERDELPTELAGLTDEALREEYSKRFPVLFGKALQVIGKELETGEIRLVIEYPNYPSTESGYIYDSLDYLHREIGLLPEDVAAVPLSGSADDACSVIADKQYVIDQLADVSDEKLFEAVRALCDEPELTCRKDAIEYIVWMVACNINDR